MKYLFPVAILFISLIAAAFLYKHAFNFEGAYTMTFESKKNMIRSRLLEVPILLYHNIDGGGQYSVDSNTLTSQFQILRDENITVIPLKELVSRIENPAPFNEKVIVITFDDGFPSMYTKLLPIANEFKYPVTLFVYTDFIHTQAEQPLSWKNLIEMDRGLIDIQSHSISHTSLTGIPSQNGISGGKKLFDEIYMSKRLLEAYLEKQIVFFAFPYGEYNQELTELCMKAGYRRVFSTDYGPNIITADNFCLRRHHIKRDYSAEKFKEIIHNY